MHDCVHEGDSDPDACRKILIEAPAEIPYGEEDSDMSEMLELIFTQKLPCSWLSVSVFLRGALSSRDDNSAADH